MCSIEGMNDNMFGAALAYENEFKRAMDAVDKSIADCIVPSNFAIPDTFNTEVTIAPPSSNGRCAFRKFGGHLPHPYKTGIKNT